MCSDGGACAMCRSVVYCSKACQRKHWPVHKETCIAIVACAGSSEGGAAMA